MAQSSWSEYRPGQRFPGVVGRTTEESSPAWPQPVRAVAGAPNVLFIVFDDTGFGQFGCYGSPIDTPNLDALAAGGLLYNNMHTTALCSPSRSCIITGRNHHANGMAAITELATGYPGYNGQIPFENGFLSEMLLQHGYNTYMVGKWHLMPSEQESAAGPYDRWPLGRGFERFYGFLGGDTSQWYPDLVYDNHQVEPPATPEDGYHLTEDLVERAMSFIADAKQVAPDKPFFLNLCPGATHAPHHVPKEWADRYRGRFDDGWDAYREQTFARQKQLGVVPADARLSPRDPDVPTWESLSPEARRLAARMMEVYAGFLSHTDHHLGRLVDFLKETGEFDNTLIMVVSDNGASAEGGATGTTNEVQFFNNAPETLEESLKQIDGLGGPTTFNHYPWGWTWAGNTPFRRWKRETYRGGTSDPFLVHWPDGIKARGAIRDQFAHIIDMVPTVLDVLGIEAPATIRGVTQSPLHGVSFAHTFDDAAAASRHRTQYYEMLGHRAIDHDGWRAVCPWPGPSFAEAERPFGTPITMADLDDLDAHHWELYHVDQDIAETRNLAQEHRSKLIEMIALWYVEAGKYNVMPIDGSVLQRIMTERPQITQNRTSYTFRSGTQAVPAAVAPRVLNRPHSVTADVEIPPGGAQGVLLCQGTNAGGWSLYVKDGHLHYAHNYVQRALHHVASSETVPEGRHALRFEFEPTGAPDIAHGKGAPGRAQLYIDGRLVGETEMPVTTPITFNPGGMACGANPGSAVTPDYQAPFRFTGTLHSVTVDLSGDLIVDVESEMRMHMARQ
ncbi:MULTISPECIES: arylsulfatase [unclassified Streptomyces]|uniref:arylsulfatase n=1 Tax=unclassified Streptomyces TaxID=2593676 RepID=UPI002257A720|nr:MULTISPECIES: arylsulfatase [unclassified Streptomyces]MCX4529938.1 arylsulfatase [Streptomyces sp. NBC_01551]MCX4546827.1 arylsulfatase [Streptomyces sp. NBC_01565]